ncbi:MAG TPA: glutathione S-transferase family protein [Myxococcota bacterium]|nr:glutathione S-transferase family protein [Myxococcota bacterium]
MALTIYHLERSRSDRIIWLAEELGLQYELVRFKRDPQTQRAEPALRAHHPLGKSPAIRDGELVVHESGAIVEYLVVRRGKGRLAPATASADWPRYVQWLHYAEGSAMHQLVLDLFVSGAFGGGPPSPAAPAMRQATREMLGMLERELASRPCFAGAEFSAADVMMEFPIRMAAGFKLLDGLPSLQAYLKRMAARPAYQRAMKIAA